MGGGGGLRPGGAEEGPDWYEEKESTPLTTNWPNSAPLVMGGV